MERHRLLWLWLDQNPGFTAGARRILHVAPEPPLRRRFDHAAVRQYITADLNSSTAAVRCDVQDLPFRDAWFDLIVCNHVLEHVPEDRRAMTELHRVLAADGRAILLCPIARDRMTTLEDPEVDLPRDRLFVYGQEDHARLYGSDYPDRLRDAGFEVEEVNFLQSLSQQAVTRHALRQNHDHFGPDTLYFARRQRDLSAGNDGEGTALRPLI